MIILKCTQQITKLTTRNDIMTGHHVVRNKGVGREIITYLTPLLETEKIALKFGAIQWCVFYHKIFSMMQMINF